MSMIVYEAGTFEPGPIKVSPLTEGMGEAMPLMIQSKNGVTREEALELLPEVREVASRYPEDAGVLAALAEAEFDAGNNAEAIAAADAAIVRDPTIANAYVQKGYALFSMAADADDTEAAYKAAMSPFIALNARENDHPLPLMYLYYSYLWPGAEPSETAKDALYQASVLAPFDESLTLATAYMYASEGNVTVASAYLEPLAKNPHGGNASEYAKAMIGALADAEPGVPFYYEPTDDQAVAAESGDEQESGAETQDEG